MRRKRGIVGVLATVVLLTLWLVPSLGARGQDRDELSSEEKERRTEITRAAVQKWQSLLGNVDFSQKPLCNSLAYLHPQPITNVLPFDGVELSEALRQEHSFWLKAFFNDAVLDELLQLSPSGYYLNEGKQEPSFLLFETMYEQNEVTLIENGNLVFLTIRPAGYDPGAGVTSNFIDTFFGDYLRLDDGKRREVLSDLSLPGRMPEGSTFSSSNAGDFLRSRDWQDQIVGFVGSSGVNIMLFKTDSRETASMGIQYDFNWLNRGLLQ